MLRFQLQRTYGTGNFFKTDVLCVNAGSKLRLRLQLNTQVPDGFGLEPLVVNLDSLEFNLFAML